MSLFVAGLVSGFTHCMAMCGPFVISQTKGIEKMREAALLPYHFGRLSTYVFLSILIYSVLNLVFLYLPVRSYLIAPILMTAGFIFLINAFPNLSKFFKWAGVIKISLPYRLVSDLFQKLSVEPTTLKKYLMGIILGFMPCGMVTSALMASATAPTVMKAAIAMAAFGAGTIPALMMTAFGGQALRLKYPSAMPYVTRGMMIWSSASLFIIAGMLLI
jgi:sulfite exporter TauE/SafE